MKISFIEAGYFKLDGGAMFGVVPKTLWSKRIIPDEDNMCTWNLRCLLIEYKDQKILVDTGIGKKQNEKFRSHFHPHGPDLKGSLLSHGITPEEITDVILTHFHFDHVGGAVKKDEGGKLVPTFPNADYWATEEHYKWAYEPNAREKASFLKENFVPLYEEGVLKFIPDEKEGAEFNDRIKLHPVYGHTASMLLPEIETDEGQKILYGADLFPSSHHISLPWIMSYDVKPLVTLEEKKKWLSRLYDEQMFILFEHDKNVNGGRIIKDNRERFRFEEVENILQVL